MLKITKNGNSILVVGQENDFFPQNGTIEVPCNSVIVVVDESNIVTFRSAFNYDVLFSGRIGDIQIGGSLVTKENISATFGAIANTSGGGGGEGGGLTPEQEVLLYNAVQIDSYNTDKGRQNAIDESQNTAIEGITEDIEAIEGEIENKQDKIEDLDGIRNGANLGLTALQEESDPTVPSYVKTITEANINKWNDSVTTEVLNDYVTNDVFNEKISDIELFKFPNVTIIGEPTISHGQISGFSTMNYLQFPFILDLHNQAFQIDFCFTTATNVQTQQNILDSKFGLALAIKDGKGLMAISSNGTSWNIGSISGTMNIESNTTYYARLTWDGIQYKTLLSTDGTNYTQDMVLVGAQAIHPATIFIGGCDTLETGHDPHPFLGTINMNKAQLTVSGNVVWLGMDDAGLATRLSTDLYNIDDNGVAKIKDIVKDEYYTKSEIDAMIGVINVRLENIIG